uniref:Ulp1 protease family, C-terminal catalytic domain-containing protein n=1 Tax=Tanacetum cinerariifolium TaxID=118510 RepID=A0A6L2N8J2_TANCI|nr:hypothetical protein [Tanacetum cinerariifolium]
MVYYLLVEKMHPFTRNILHQMLNDVRLQVDYEVEMAYDLLRLIRRQINKDKHEEALDGEETDDDFISSENIKMNKVVGIKKKPSLVTATNNKCIADPENSNVKEKAAKDKVLYASSYTPIKWCTSDVLKTLEKDKFPNDDGDNADVVQESEDEGLDEEHVREDNKFGEYGPDRVPTDVGLDEEHVREDNKFREYRPDRVPTDVEIVDSHRNQETTKSPMIKHMITSTHHVMVEHNMKMPLLREMSYHSPSCANFDDGANFDLNITQPLATQGKKVGDEQEPQDVPEFKTPNQPKRASPKDRSTSRGYYDGPRCVLETLYPGIKIASWTIDMFTHVLNDTERSKNKQTTTRLFYHTAMLTSEMLKWKYSTALEKFNENMELVSGRSQYKRLDGVELIEYLDNIFSMEKDPYARYGFPSMILVSLFEDYMLHIDHPSYRQMSANAEKRILTGEGDRCCLKKEGPKQRKQINDLQYKYAVKILLADWNKAKSMVEQETHAFKTLPVEEKKRLRAETFKKSNNVMYRC